MTESRILIKQALFAKAQAATFATAIAGHNTWALSSRRLRLWPQVDPDSQPAMFMVQHRESYQNPGRGTESRRFLDIGFWCYARTDSDDILGDDLLDIMITGLENALAPDNTPENTLDLGGMVYWVKIMNQDNMYIRDPGDVDGQALLVLPVRILMP